MKELFGTVMCDIEDVFLTDQDKTLISNKYVGGLILFSRNYESHEQLKNLIDEIFSIKENIIIAVDQEGGRVQRFVDEFTKIPSMQKITYFAKINNNYKIFKEIGWLISKELLSVGVDINFAPVLDINEKKSSIIGDRSFSKDVDEIIQCASLLIDGMHEAGMMSTGKHFPGHGGVLEDSHFESPIDNKKLEDLINHAIKPYISLSNKLDAIMCAHIMFPNIDSEIPSLSNIWIKNILKDRLKYNGIVFSDDLSMIGSGQESCIVKTKKSLEAGCDMVIICNDRKEVINVLNFLNENKYDLSEKLFTMKKKEDANWSKLLESQRANKIKKLLYKIGS